MGELRVWEYGEYETNPYYPENRIFPTKKGDYVRSKSEAWIADALFENGIPYRYEEKTILNGHVHYTDFSIRHPRTGAPIKLEHCGLMDDIRYIRITGYRLIDYASEGYLLGRNLFMTMESKANPLTSADINRVIDSIVGE